MPIIEKTLTEEELAEIEAEVEAELEAEEAAEVEVEVEVEEAAEVEESGEPGYRMCEGLFAQYPISAFTQDSRYCDAFLKSKGLFKTV